MKKLILGMIVVIIIILGIGSYIFISHRTTSPKSSTNSSISSSSDSKAVKTDISTNTPKTTTSSTIPQNTTSSTSNVIANKSTTTTNTSAVTNPINTTANNNLKYNSKTSSSKSNLNTSQNVSNFFGIYTLSDVPLFTISNLTGSNNNLNSQINLSKNKFINGNYYINNPNYAIVTVPSSYIISSASCPELGNTFTLLIVSPIKITNENITNYLNAKNSFIIYQNKLLSLSLYKHQVAFFAYSK